jgi:gliding motility-associated-like protein
MEILKPSLIYKIKLVVFVLFSFSTVGALNYTEIEKNQKNLTPTITASIATADEELCVGEQTIITFKGFDGGPFYTFTYTFNDGSEETISTINDENSVSLNTSITSSGPFSYKLIKVQDSSGNIEGLNEEILITVTNPPTISFVFTNDGVCSNETIDFTSSVSGDGPFSYNWDFGDGNTSTDENPSHTYNTMGSGLQSLSVTLSVTDNNICSSSVTETLSVQKTPNISFFSGGNLKNCSAQGDGFEVEFFNSSESSSDITSYTFDWGDGSSETLSGVDFPANGNGVLHTFELGVFTVLISATSINGCSDEVEFEVIYGNDPGGGLQSPPNTSGICFPTEELNFGIVGWGENSEETTYELDFGDGTIESYTQAKLEGSSSYDKTDPSMSSIFLTKHSYKSGSCSEENGEFIVKLTITNACNNKVSTANNVVILQPSVSLFDIDPVGCVNVPLEFDNQSIIGDNVDCVENARFSWDWGDGKVQNFPPGSSTDDQSHTYTQPGNYTVILSVVGDCGKDTYEKNICIESEIIASYTLDSQEGCVPFAVAAQNTIDGSQLCSDPNYNWTVAFEDINCNTLSDWEFTNGTDASSENPQFLFNNPGNYTLTQNITTGCGNFFTQKVITVKKPPTVSINPIDNFCQPGLINPTAIIENCTNNQEGVTYNWVFSGGTPSSSTLKNPENISYDTLGIHTITLEVTNGCGTSNTAMQEFEVLEKPVVTNLITTQEICSNQSTISIPLTSENPITTYSWTATTDPVNTNITGYITNGSTSEIPSQIIVNNGTTVGNVIFTVIPVLNDCTGEPIKVLTVIVNATPSIVTQPISSDICLDGLATQLSVVTQNGVGTPTYQWYSNTTNSNIDGTLIGDATNNTYDPPTDIVGVFYYYVAISFDGGCDDISSDIASVNINQIPVIDFAEITIYSGETFLFDPSTVTSNAIPIGTTFTWVSPTSGIPGTILGSSAESSPQINISQTLENISSPPEPVTETYEITPATPSCIGDPFIFKVIVNPSLISNALITNNSCFESNDGAIDTDITGGVPFTSGPPYLISWNGPNSFTSTAGIIKNLIAGDYTLRIEDKNGFFIIENHIVTEPDILLITTDIEKNISCFGGNDGAIEVSVSGGTAPFTFNWTGNDILQGNQNQSGLTAGTYLLEIIDKKLCVTNQTYILTEPDILTINTISKEDILCFDDFTGSIEINVIGGTPVEVSSGIFDYVYNWTGPNGFTSNSQNISNLFAGIYTIEITDDMGCTKKTDIILTQPTAIEIDYTKTDVICYGAADGSIDVTVTGGEPPYQITWGNLGNSFSQSNLSAGDYIVKITDKNQCEENITITIEQPMFFIDPVVTSISCNNADDASIDLNLVGGVAPISVAWSDDASAGVQRNNLGPGTYTVTILDSNLIQCPIIKTFTIINPPELALTSIVNDAIDCVITNSGIIELDVSGGTSPYNFLWNTGQTSEDLLNIPPGDYSVEIKDSRGCIINREFTVFRQKPISISLVEKILTDCSSNTIKVQNVPIVTGGFLPYTYSWSSGVTSGSNNEIMTTTQSGAYILTITDDKGCAENISVQINVPDVGSPEFSFESFAYSQYSYISIEDPIQFNNLSTGNFTNVSWDFGDGSPTVNTVDAVHTYDQVGTYTVILTVEYDYGCVFQSTQDINITKGYLLVTPNAFSPNEDGINDVIRPLFRGFTSIKMSIFDTWGTLVYFEEGTSLEGWNGFVNDKPAENGNYIMYIDGITFFGKEVKKGTSITLLK